MNFKLHEGEKILIEVSPHKKAAWYWTIAKIWHLIFVWIIFAFYVGIFATGASKNGGENTLAQAETILHHFNHPFLILIVIGIVLICIIHVWFRMVTKAYKYTVTNQRTILRYGLIALNTRIIPHSQVNDVDMRSTFVERPFGLGSVYVDNIGTIFGGSGGYAGRRGSSNNTTRLEGLTYEQCEEVMNAISEEMTRAKK